MYKHPILVLAVYSGRW